MSFSFLFIVRLLDKSLMLLFLLVMTSLTDRPILSAVCFVVCVGILCLAPICLCFESEFCRLRACFLILVFVVYFVCPYIKTVCFWAVCLVERLCFGM